MSNAKKIKYPQTANSMGPEYKMVYNEEGEFVSYEYIGPPDKPNQDKSNQNPFAYSMRSYERNQTREDILKLLDDLEFWISRSLPKNGETWEKKPCSKGLCRCGHSLGVGIHKVDFSKNLDWGGEQQIKCGCLIRIITKDDIIKLS